jgi:ACS family glucarate transporter-like MFS transporter
MKLAIGDPQHIRHNFIFARVDRRESSGRMRVSVAPCQNRFDMKKWRGVRWILIGWIFVISAIAYLDRVNISIAGKSMAAEYGLTDLQLGYVFSAFVIGYALFQAPGGRLADRIGPRRTLLGAVVWWGVFTTLSAAIPSGMAHALIILIAVRFALGVGEAVVYPSSNRFVAAWVPSVERGLANGLIFAGVGAGAGVTPPLIVYVMQTYGWRASFIVSAAIGLIAGVIWYLLARDRPSEHPMISADELRHIETGLPPAGSEKRAILPWGSIFSSKDLAAMTLSYFAYGYTAYIFFTWFFIYLSSVRGLDLKASRYYAMLPFIAMAVCSSLGGWISDRVAARSGERVGRCGIAAAGMALAAIFVALATQVESARLASIVLAGGAGALYISQSAFWAVTAEIAGPSAGTVSGVMNMGGQIGGAVTASLSPWIAGRFGWTASFLTAAALCGVGAALWSAVNPAHRMFRASSSGKTGAASPAGVGRQSTY